MLRKRIITFLFFFILPNSLFAGWPTGAGPLQIRIPCFNTRWIMAFTGIYENFYTPELDYAIRYPIEFIEGRVRNDDSDYDWGFTGTLGYVFPCSANDIQASYNYFDSEEVDHTRRVTEFLVATLSEPFFVSTIDVLPAFFSFGPPIIFAPFPGSDIVISPEGIVTITLNPTDLTSARAVSKFRNNVADINFGQYVDVDELFRIRGFFGVRYAYVKHNYDANYEFGPTTVSGIFLFSSEGGPFTQAEGVFNTSIDVLVAQRSQYTGLGPRAGFNSNLYLGNGFGLFGSLSGALLIGDARAKIFNVERATTSGVVIAGGTARRLPNSFATTVESAQFPSQPRIVPNISTEVGVDYTFSWAASVQSAVTLAVGYQLDHYFNAIDRVAALNLSAPEFRTRHPMDADFAGFFLRIEARV